MSAEHAISARARGAQGAPRAILFTMGRTVAPFSVGAQGTWRIAGGGVNRVHAYFRFDGRTVAVRAADAEAATLVDGNVIAPAWTPLSVPSIVRLGAVRIVIDQHDPHDVPSPWSDDDVGDARAAAPLFDGTEPADALTQVIDHPLGLTRQPARHAGAGEIDVAQAPAAARSRRPGALGDEGHSTRIMDIRTLFPQQVEEPPAGATPLPPSPKEPRRAARVRANALAGALARRWRKASFAQRALLVLMPFALASVIFRVSAEARPQRGALSSQPHDTTETVLAPAASPPSSEAPRVANSALAGGADTQEAAREASRVPLVREAAQVGTTSGAATTRSIQRQAVDALARGDRAVALGLYEELAHAYPDAPAYREAARILLETRSARPR